MTSRKSSGSMRADSAVEPTKSENITVTWRRSAVSLGDASTSAVGHRRQSAFDRWWSGPKGAYLMDYTDCSLLVARNAVSDEAIETAFMTSGPDG